METDKDKDKQRTALPAVTIHITYRGANFSLEVDAYKTLHGLQEDIANATDVQIPYQKIVAPAPLRSVFNIKRSPFNTQDDGEHLEATLFDLGLNRAQPTGKPIKLMLIGPKQYEIDALRAEDDLGVKMNRPRQYHPSMLRGTKVSGHKSVRSSAHTFSASKHGDTCCL